MNGMDLFFFNIIIQFNGTLQTKVQHIGVDLKSAAVFHYDLRIANEKVQLHRHGKVWLLSAYSMFHAVIV